MNTAVVINPISGTRGRAEVARRRAERAVRALAAHGLDGEVFVTERPGHARELARAAIGRGAGTVVAWGGDGTMNEVASELAFTGASLGIVPSGSGNGLARELGIPFDVAAALEIALVTGRDRIVDAGEIDGRLFFNLAGIGFDARVAHRFAAGGAARRGFLRYLEIATQELFTYRPDEYTVVVDADRRRVRALLVVVANGRQYGNGAVIAPHARLDDGRLDVVVVEDRSVVATLVQVPRLFAGRVDRVRGVTLRRGEAVAIASERPLAYHVDGEPFVGEARIEARVRPAALRVRAPDRAGKLGLRAFN